MTDGPTIDLRANDDPPPAASPPGDRSKRFDCFLIDTGWNEQVSPLVRSHLPLYFGSDNPDPLYILSYEQSVDILRREPALIGNDPIVLVYDLQQAPPGKDRGQYRGFRLNLGLLKQPQQALARLQDFVRFLMMHRKSQSLERDVKQEMHREGLQGMIKVLRDVSEKTIEMV